MAWDCGLRASFRVPETVGTMAFVYSSPKTEPSDNTVTLLRGYPGKSIILKHAPM